MLSCNLAVLLAERNLKISKISADTGISRTTLTSLANNYSQGIQFDTLNTLCLYLRVRPQDILFYAPYDFECNFQNLLDNQTFELKFGLFSKVKNHEGIFRCSAKYFAESNYATVLINVLSTEGDFQMESTNTFLKFTSMEWGIIEKQLNPVVKENFFSKLYPDIDIESLEIDYEIN